MKWLREHTAEITITAIVIAVGVGVFAYAHRDEDSLEESKVRGAAIVEALERFRMERNDYPETLDALVPRFLPTIEPPTWGLQRWSYRRYRPGEVGGNTADSSAVYFQLSVPQNENGYPVLYYDITTRRWVLNN